MHLRFLAGEPHYVPLLGRQVAPDELVEVDNTTFEAYSWPDTLWHVLPAKTHKTKSED